LAASQGEPDYFRKFTPHPDDSQAKLVHPSR